MLYFYRLHKALRNKSKWSVLLIPVFLLERLFETFYDIHISPSAEISDGLYIGHFGGIYIGNCTIGENCNINHQVSIGSFTDKTDDKKVVIGKNVWIGAHTKILPGVSIGDSATISAGTVVDRNIPGHCLVTGEKCRTINSHFDNSKLLFLDNEFSADT